MKIFLVFIIAVFWILKPVPSIDDCNIRTIKQALPPIIWFEQKIDGGSQSVLLTRFLHNKVGIGGSQFAKCYFNSLDPQIAYKSVGLLGLAFWLFFIYYISSRKIWPLILIFLLVPIFPVIFDRAQAIAIFYKIFAMLGALYYFKNYE